MARPLNRKAFVLLILAVALVFLFFSHYRERTQQIQVEDMQQQIAATESLPDRQKLEFELGLYFERNSQHDQAYRMFQRVCTGYPYPDIHYGYLRDEAVWKMEEYTQRGWASDTTVL